MGISTDIPAIVRDVMDDESVIAMVDSNIQRLNILPSEKARAYRMKMEAMEHQGVKGGQHTAALGEAFGESARTVHRYIRLTYLMPELLELVDQKQIRDFFTFLRLKIVATCLNDVYNGSNRRLCYGTKRQTDPAFKVKA